MELFHHPHAVPHGVPHAVPHGVFQEQMPDMENFYLDELLTESVPR